MLRMCVPVLWVPHRSRGCPHLGLPLHQLPLQLRALGVVGASQALVIQHCLVENSGVRVWRGVTLWCNGCGGVGRVWGGVCRVVRGGLGRTSYLLPAAAVVITSWGAHGSCSTCGMSSFLHKVHALHRLQTGCAALGASVHDERNATNPFSQHVHEGPNLHHPQVVNCLQSS